MPHLQRERVGIRRAVSEAREIYRRRSGAPRPEPAAPSRSGALARRAAQRLKPPLRDDPDVYLDVPRLRGVELGATTARAIRGPAE